MASLVVENLEFSPAAATRGEPLRARFILSNKGTTATVPISCRIYYYRNLDSSLTTTPKIFSDEPCPATRPGVRVTITRRFTVPVGSGVDVTPFGYLGVAFGIDLHHPTSGSLSGILTESERTDALARKALVPITIKREPLPDLVVDRLRFIGDPWIDRNITVTFRIVNQGNRAASAFTYAAHWEATGANSWEEAGGGIYTPLAYSHIAHPGLDAGQESSHSVDLQFPDDGDLRRYRAIRFRGSADTDRIINESDEGNNMPTVESLRSR